jgi:hypothetical protein
MNSNSKSLTLIYSVIVVFILLMSSFLPAVLADLEVKHHTGFQKGITWKPFIPMKKTTFIQQDETSLLDDYAYLSAIPSSVFYDKNKDVLFSSPLLFFNSDFTPKEIKERSLDSYEGINYFMEDWMSYSKGSLDKMTLININENELDSSWKAQNTTQISGNNPYTIASKIALSDWSYADKAVIAVIQESYKKPDNKTKGMLTGSLDPGDGTKTEHFEVPQTNDVYPIYNTFTVPESYKFLKVRSWYPCFYFEAGLPGFEGIINMSIPAGDRDLQVYCQEDGKWMMAGITSEWNTQGGMDVDKTSVYVYKSGIWSVAITDVPTKSYDYINPWDEDTATIKDTSIEDQKHRSFLTFNFGRYGSFLEVLKNMRQVTYQVDVEMFPGIEIEIPDNPPIGCRNVQINLSWDDPNVDLGFSLIGPSGEEVLSTREPGVSTKCASSIYDEDIPLPPGTETDLHVHQLGRCLPGESYKICVFSMNDLTKSTDFTIEYSWGQNFSEKEAVGIASATEGAILASELNAPLLYVSTDDVPEITKNTLYKLGVNEIYLVNINDYLSKEAKDEIKNGFSIPGHYTSYEEIYYAIRDISESNDIIFSTIDPWSSWYVAELKPNKEIMGLRSFGPAAYIAAHHGSPVLLVDNHEELSTAVVWHNELWRRHPDGHSRLPTVSEMYLTGTRVYNFLKSLGFDKEGEEVIITVAGQYDIGLPWDRVFVGKAKPGRFFGSPTDLSTWISKSIFYPMIVFENPAINNPNGVTLINGSSSKRRFPWRGTLGLKITKESMEEVFDYPILDTLVCYDIKFNTRASTYWGFEYKCADGTIPGRSQSFDQIDEGVMVAVNGEEGAYFPDLSGAEVQPFYIRQGGFTPVFSTNFDANMFNLNQGVLLWMVNTHGAPMNGGMFMFWDVDYDNPTKQGYPPLPFTAYKKEDNPWRGYEWLMGSTEEPDTMTMDIHGIIPMLLGNPDPIGIYFFKTGLDWALAKRPIRDFIGNIASLPILRQVTPDWLQDTQDYYDGVIITVLLSRLGTSWYNGTQIDDELENIHSAGVSSVACLPAGKFLHLTLMRHGSPFQIMDPWATSWYSDVWQNSVPRGIAAGETIGEIYMEGIKKVGIQYVRDGSPQWWWDLAENVCLYGDPNMRVWVPSTEFSTNNHWTEQDIQAVSYSEERGLEINGHNPFGTVDHPHQKQPSAFLNQNMILIITFVIIIILIMVAILFRKRK